MGNYGVSLTTSIRAKIIDAQATPSLRSRLRSPVAASTFSTTTLSVISSLKEEGSSFRFQQDLLYSFDQIRLGKLFSGRLTLIDRGSSPWIELLPPTRLGARLAEDPFTYGNN